MVENLHTITKITKALREEECIQGFGRKTWRKRDLDRDLRILLKWISKNQHGRVWTGFVWLGQTCCRFLWSWWQAFDFHRMPADLLISLE
jgi:hypothetical protein